MEDNDLRKYFKNFNPDLTPAEDFLKNIEKNLEIIEDVKKELKRETRMNKFALIISAVVGFIAGIIAMLVIPRFSAWINSLFSKLGMENLPFSPQIISYVFFTTAIGLVVVACYVNLSRKRI